MPAGCGRRTRRRRAARLRPVDPASGIVVACAADDRCSLPVVSRLVDPAGSGAPSPPTRRPQEPSSTRRRSRPLEPMTPRPWVRARADTARRPACPADRPNRTPGGTARAAGGVPGPAGRDCFQPVDDAGFRPLPDADPESVDDPGLDLAGESPAADGPAPVRGRAVGAALPEDRPLSGASKRGAERPRARSRSRRCGPAVRGGRVVARGSRRVVRVAPASRTVATSRAGEPDLALTAVRSDDDQLSRLRPGGPAVSAEPWVAAPVAPLRQSSRSAPSVQASSVQAPSVQRCRTGPCRPDLALRLRRVGRSGVRGVPVPAGRVEPDGRRRSADSRAAQCRAPHRSGFRPVVDPRAAGRFAPGGGKRPPGSVACRAGTCPSRACSGQRRDPPAETSAAADAGFTSVQLQSADTAPAPSEPAGEPAPSAPASSAAPAPGARPEPRRPIWTRWPAGSTSRCRRDCGPNCGSTASEPG